MIAWVLLVAWALMLMGMWMLRDDPEIAPVLAPTRRAEVAAFVGVAANAVLMPVCAVGLLKGWNWARLVLAVTAIAGLVFGGVHFSAGIIIDLLIIGAGAYFLFNRRADAFFGKTYLKG